MIKLLRKVPEYYFGLLTILVGVCSGLRMISPDMNKDTYLCFDKGCTTVQGYTLLIISAATLVWLIWSQVKERRRLGRIAHLRSLRDEGFL